MNSSSGVDALRPYQAESSQVKKERVILSAHDAGDSETLITIAGIARRADVSREFIYSHPVLLVAITKARAAQGVRTAAAGRPISRDVAHHAERETFIAKIHRLEENKVSVSTRLNEREVQRKRRLGGQLAQLSNPVVTAELRVENDRLIAHAVELTREVEILQAITDGLREELHIARVAHAGSVAELGGVSNPVVVLRPSEH